MKKPLVSIFTIMFAVPAMANISITGRILDEHGAPLVGAFVMDPNMSGVGGYVESDGTIPSDIPFSDNITNLQISMMGYETQTVAINPNNPNIGSIRMQPDTEVLEASVTTACQSTTGSNKLYREVNSEKCYPYACRDAQYEPSGNSVAWYTGGNSICIGSADSGGPCANFCAGGNCQSITVYDSCDYVIGKECTPENTSHVKEAKYAYDASTDTLRCEIKKCDSSDYTPNDAKNQCVQSQGDCTDAAKKRDKNATAGVMRDGICYITDCITGFDPNDAGTQCVQKTGTDSTPQLSQEDAQAEIDELRENADAMREREQSLANKTIGAAAIGATGIGGMQLASALAEQRADDAAEQDMTAYLATFRCDYGAGRNISGGEVNIQLPGANTLLPLYNEYTTLAADLKTRKTALGMTPGLESEVILDAATSGLYDNESLGKTDGAYTSLARALSDPNSTDAAEWAAQRADTQQQLKTGAITAGAGALVGIVGNVLTNYVGDKPREQSAEIRAKYDAKRTLLSKNLSSTQEKSMREAITNAPAVEEGKEQDASATSNSNIDNLFQTTVSKWQSSCAQQGGTWDALNMTCICPGNAWWDSINDECVKPNNSGINLNITTSNESKTPVAVFFADSLFDSGKTTLKSTTELNKSIQELRTATSGETNFKLLLVGYTDTDRILTWKDICTKDKICDNNALGRARAQTVADYIKSQWPDLPTNAISVDTAGEQCAKKTTDAKQKALYRKVAVYVAFDGEALPVSGEYCSAQ